MGKSMRILLFTFLMTVMCAAVALAYNPGQRTIKLLGQTLNSDKHPVHLVVSQTIDMRDVLTADAYNNLPTAKKKRTSRTEYNENNGIAAKRATIIDGEGKIIKDNVDFCKDGFWYAIDLVNKTYDRVPALPGMSSPFAESLIGWFNVRPVGGNDAATGYDYDRMTKGNNTLTFYYEKDTEKWLGYQTAYLPFVKVEEVSNVADESYFALPSAEYKQVADPAMRARAQSIMEKRNKK